MNELAEKIARKIRQDGPICFAEFMDLALYCPILGYYEGEKDKVGRQGDFYTSVSAGQVFGSLIAFQIAEWFKSPGLCGDGNLQIVEAGAHRGHLAHDILAWLSRHAPETFARLHYWILEPSPARQRIQQDTLADFEPRVLWGRDFDDLAARCPSGIRGVILSNELLDAMPVHRVGWDAIARTWFERGVGLEGDHFAWCRFPRPCPSVASSPKLSGLPADLCEVLPEGFTTEVGTAALEWWQKASGALVHGYLVTFDYGLERDDFFEPHRANGTLRGYRHHKYVEDILQEPGFQDLTAHVDFTSIRQTGETNGLATLAQMQQARFLIQTAERYWNGGFPTWGAKELGQFKTVTHMEGLGRAVQVLIQTRR